MLSYSSSSPTYGQYGQGSVPDTDASASSSGYSFIRFTGAGDVLAALSITSATLTLTTVSDEGGDDTTVKLRGDATEDGSLPADVDAADARPLTTATGTGVVPVALSGTVGIDVAAVITELKTAIDGDVIQFKFEFDPYLGYSPNVTASLAIEYSLGDINYPGCIRSNQAVWPSLGIM